MMSAASDAMSGAMFGGTTGSWGTPWWGSDAGHLAEERAAKPRMSLDTELVDRCLNGDRGAWGQLVQSHTQLVYGACYRFTNQAEESRDLTQDVFLRVFRSLRTFDARSGSFRTWLIRLTRNLLIDHYRRNKKHKVLDPLEDRIPVLEEKALVGGSSDRTLRSREAAESLQAGLQRLSPDLREAVILRDLQEMEYKEIAQVLRVPEGTVKSRINRGRIELAKNLRAMGVRP